MAATAVHAALPGLPGGAEAWLGRRAVGVPAGARPGAGFRAKGLAALPNDAASATAASGPTFGPGKAPADAA